MVKKSWEELVKEQPELVKRYNDFCNEMRLAFRPVQQDAMRIYEEWEKQMEEESQK